MCLQYGFISIHSPLQAGSDSVNGNGDSVFFHMKGMSSGCDFSALHVGDEVEFLLVTNTKAKKNSAIHVKKLRYAMSHVRSGAGVLSVCCVCVYIYIQCEC